MDPQYKGCRLSFGERRSEGLSAGSQVVLVPNSEVYRVIPWQAAQAGQLRNIQGLVPMRTKLIETGVRTTSVTIPASARPALAGKDKLKPRCDHLLELATQ